jgi:hypothetical protein
MPLAFGRHLSWRGQLRSQPWLVGFVEASTIAMASAKAAGGCHPVRLVRRPRANLTISLTLRMVSCIRLVRPPLRKFPFCRPDGPPPPAPCIRQTRQPRTAGARQGFPVRFDLAPHRGASCALCMGSMLIFLSYPPPQPDRHLGSPWPSGLQLSACCRRPLLGYSGTAGLL